MHPATAPVYCANKLRKKYSEALDVRQTAGARLPLVRMDPASGRKALSLGRRQNSYIVDLPLSESEALLDALRALAIRDAFTMGHTQRVGDLLTWNNFSVLHPSRCL